MNSPYQAQFIPESNEALRSLHALPHALRIIFDKYVLAHHGRYTFRDDIFLPDPVQEHSSMVILPGNDSRLNAAKAAAPFFKAFADVTACLDPLRNEGPDNYAACTFYFLLYALYLGTCSGRTRLTNITRQLSWLSQVPMHAESILEYPYRLKWFTKTKLLRGTILFLGAGVGEVLASESERIMKSIAACKAIQIQDVEHALSDRSNSLLVVFVLSEIDLRWAIPLIESAIEKGLCTAAVTMHSLQYKLSHADACLPFPTVEPIAVPVLGILPVQVFANDIAISKGIQTHSLLQ